MAIDKDVSYGSAYTKMVIRALEERGSSRSAFSGRSMTPTITDGMQILVERADPSEIKPADIIMYKKPDRAVVHRVINIIRDGRERLFVTKGDNHAYMDADRIPASDLIGRVTAAFFEHDPGKNVLVKTRAVGALYVGSARLVLTARHFRKYAPQPLRRIFKYAVGGFFFTVKKLIHAVYLGTRHGKLSTHRLPLL